MSSDMHSHVQQQRLIQFSVAHPQCPVWGGYAHECRCPWILEEGIGLDPLKLQLRMVVSHRMSVLGAKRGSFVKTVYVLKH